MTGEADGRLFVFGFGNSALALRRRTVKRFAAMAGTTRGGKRAERLRAEGIDAFAFDGTAPGAGVAEALANATHLICSVPPDEAGDPVLLHHQADIAAARTLRWIGYLSTIGVYGDHDGAVIDEQASCRPVSARSKRRIEAERAWMQLGERLGIPVAVFRLAGIYGPGQNVMVRLKNGTARRLVKPGQVFNRIHVDDIAAICEAAIDKNAGGIFNVSDDEAAPPQDVLVYAADLIGVEPPPEEDFETAELTPMARSFYREAKIVSNAKAKTELGWRPIYPSYRDGLAALWENGDWDAEFNPARRR